MSGELRDYHFFPLRTLEYQSNDATRYIHAPLQHGRKRRDYVLCQPITNWYANISVIHVVLLKQ
jgi:hypothetical protein